jgi:hypothetical protein
MAHCRGWQRAFWATRPRLRYRRIRSFDRPACSGPGGRFVGIYNCRDHLAELWREVLDSAWDEESFDCESGPEV